MRSLFRIKNQQPLGLFVVCMLSLALFGCKPIYLSETNDTSSIMVSDYTAIDVNGPFNIHLVKSTPDGRVDITGDSALLSDTHVRVTNHVLYVYLDKLRSYGSVRGNRLKLDIPTGDRASLNIYLSGDAFMDARHVQLTDSYVSVKDNAFAYVNARGVLSAFASNTGRIYYEGNPILWGLYSDGGEVLQIDGNPNIKTPPEPYKVNKAHQLTTVPDTTSKAHEILSSNYKG